MGADWKRPNLPVGPLRDLNAALHELRARSGNRSSREIAMWVTREFKHQTSHTTIHRMFTQPERPDPQLMRWVVNVLARRTSAPDLDVACQAEVAHFHQLWNDAFDHEQRDRRQRNVDHWPTVDEGESPVLSQGETFAGHEPGGNALIDSLIRPVSPGSDHSHEDDHGEMVDLIARTPTGIVPLGSTLAGIELSLPLPAHTEAVNPFDSDKATLQFAPVRFGDDPDDANILEAEVSWTTRPSRRRRRSMEEFGGVSVSEMVARHAQTVSLVEPKTPVTERLFRRE